MRSLSRLRERVGERDVPVALHPAAHALELGQCGDDGVVGHAHFQRDRDRVMELYQAGGWLTARVMAKRDGTALTYSVVPGPKTDLIVRGNAAVAMLRQDHRDVEKLFKEYESAGRSRKEAIIAEVCKALTLHTMLEEEVFYPACRDATSDEDDLDEAQVEHDSAKLLIADLLLGVAPGITGSLLFFFFGQIRGYDHTEAGLFMLFYFVAGLCGAPSQRCALAAAYDARPATARPRSWAF